MIAILVHSPITFFAVPAWLAWGLTIGALGLSAVLSGWLPKHPRMQKYVTALALATVLAVSIASAVHQAHIGPRRSVTIAWPPPCDGWWSYVDITCWFES